MYSCCFIVYCFLNKTVDLFLYAIAMLIVLRIKQLYNEAQSTNKPSYFIEHRTVVCGKFSKLLVNRIYN